MAMVAGVRAQTETMPEPMRTRDVRPASSDNRTKASYVQPSAT